MYLYDEVYFEITVSGIKSEIKRFVKYLKSGALDDFFEVASDFISYEDDFSEKSDEMLSEMIFANDDFGIETDKFETDDFLDIFCKQTAALDVQGHIYDINDDEYRFISEMGSVDYTDARKSKKFNDALDEIAADEEEDEY